MLQVQGPLEIEQPGLAQDYDGSVVLPASEARLHGSDIKYESGPQRDNLGFWTNPDDWADWTFQVTKAGKFEVTAEIAAPEKASLEVSVGDSRVQGTAAVDRRLRQVQGRQARHARDSRPRQSHPRRPARQRRLAPAEPESHSPKPVAD